MKLPPEAFAILAVLGIVLSLATVIGFYLGRRALQNETRSVIDNLNARIRSWWVMVMVLTAAFLAGPHAIIALFALISFCALREFITLMPTRPADRGALLASFLIALPAQYGLIWISWYGLFAVFIPVYGFVVLPILAALRGDSENFLTRAAETQWGLMVAVYCVSYVPALLTLKISGSQNRAALLIAFLLIVAQSSDVLQYIFGKLLGQHKIAPQLSPSKTVEGFLFGLLATTFLGAALWRITPFSRGQAGAMALLISLSGFLGGLVMSAIKRDHGVKDWGHLIGGHGGMLDRLDSICFSAPLFFHLTRYFFAS
jgi:phosphatidate cytidylyltransferase